MKKTNLSKIEQVSPANKALFWILFGSALVTIYFNSSLQDPFNVPKFLILICLGSLTLGFLLTDKVKNTKSKPLNLFKSLVYFFIFACFLSSVVSNDKYISFFGENLRKNGFLTYLSFSLILLAIIKYTHFSNLKYLWNSILCTSLIMSSYGFLQIIGKDFIPWAPHGKAIISTLGNSNFAGATMAIFSIIAFGKIFISKNLSLKILWSLICIFLIYVTYFTFARQAQLISLAGISLITIYLIYSKHQFTGKLMFGALIFFTIIAILGMLQIGPLQQYLYKSSVTTRGFYWDAGLKMFFSNPIFGVGFDQYASYFKEYRKPQYSLLYGNDLTSSNAHNVFIQLFATGGIFVGVSYLILMVLILLIALKGIKKFETTNRLIYVTIFSAWVAFQAQSFISIDNLGLAIWGWILGGILVALYFEIAFRSNPDKNIKVVSVNFIQPLVTSLFLILSIILSSFFYRNESSLYTARAWLNTKNEESKIQYHAISNKLLTSPFLDPASKTEIAANLISYGYSEEGLTLLENQLKNNPRNLDNLNLLAKYYESINDSSSAIIYRNQIMKYDPWSSYNYLQLGRLYKIESKYDEMLSMKAKILSFAAETDEARLALAELT